MLLGFAAYNVWPNLLPEASLKSIYAEFNSSNGSQLQQVQLLNVFVESIPAGLNVGFSCCSLSEADNGKTI